MKYIAIFFITIFAAATLQGQGEWSAPDNPVELGQVHWLRDYDDAISKSKSTGKPIFLLFQEVPGCSNCTTFGHHVLSHPFVVEMIETYYVPLAIFNNKGGKDKKILQQFKEPSWNNPVVRVINEHGQDIVPRLANNFSREGVVDRINQSMTVSNQITPKYFDIWTEEVAGASNSQEAYLSMYCFWTGEKEIAQIPGVLSTEPGFMHGKEVVKVSFDKATTDLKKVIKEAKKSSCADEVFVADKELLNLADRTTGKYRVDKDVKYYMAQTEYRTIPMTQLQASRVNALIGQRKSPNELLSPRQLVLLAGKSVSKSYINEEFETSWYQAIKGFY